MNIAQNNADARSASKAPLMIVRVQSVLNFKKNVN
jgi:hypothetical protein